MNLTIENYILINKNELDEETLQLIKNKFTYPNPLYYILKSKGVRVQPWMMYYKSFKENSDCIGISRGCIHELINLLKNKQINYTLIDNTTHNKNVEHMLLESNNFRPHQEWAIEEMSKNRQGILISDTGTGKTAIILGLIAKQKQNSLIIVTSTASYKAYKDEIKRMFGKNYKFGTIGFGEFDIKPITLVMLQTLYRFDDDKWEQVNNYFGFVAVSECHHTAPGKTYTVVNNFNACYRYGETASKTRKDKLDFLVKNAISNRLVEVTKDMLGDNFALSANVNFITCNQVSHISEIKINPETGEEIRDIREWAKAAEKLFISETRNNFIVNNIIKDVINKHIVLVLSDRVKHCRDLYNLLKEQDIKCEILVGNVKIDQRNNVIANARKGKLNVLVASCNLASESLDIPILSSVHLVSPSNNVNSSKQRTGRIRRIHATKPFPIVNDYVDVNIEMFKNTAFNRARHYKEFGFNIINKF